MERKIIIDAKPEPMSVETATTAVIVVDMQNDFCTAGGMFDRAGIDISAARNAVRATASALRAIRRVRIPAVYLKMGFREGLSDFGSSDSPNRVKHVPMAVGTGLLVRMAETAEF